MKPLFKNKSLENISTTEALDKNKLRLFYNKFKSFPESQIYTIYTVLFDLSVNVQDYTYYKRKGQHYAAARIQNQVKHQILSALCFYSEIFAELPISQYLIDCLVKDNVELTVKQECIVFEMIILIVKYVFQGWFKDFPIPSYPLIAYVERLLRRFAGKTLKNIENRYKNNSQIVNTVLASILNNFANLFEATEFRKILLFVLMDGTSRSIEFVVMQIFIEYEHSIVENGKSGELLFKKCKYQKDVDQLISKCRKGQEQFQKESIVENYIERELFEKYDLEYCKQHEIRFPFATKCLVLSKQENYQTQIKNREAEPEIEENYRKITELLNLSRIEIDNLNKKTKYLNDLKVREDNEIKELHNQQILKEKKQIQRIREMLEVVKQERVKPEFIKIPKEKLPSLQTELKNLEDEMVFLMTLQKPAQIPVMPRDKSTTRIIQQRQESRLLHQQLLQLSNMKNKLEKDRAQVIMREKNNNIQNSIRAELITKEQQKQRLIEKMEEQKCREFKQIINTSQQASSYRRSDKSNSNIDDQIQRMEEQVRAKKERLRNIK